MCNVDCNCDCHIDGDISAEKRKALIVVFRHLHSLVNSLYYGKVVIHFEAGKPIRAVEEKSIKY